MAGFAGRRINKIALKQVKTPTEEVCTRLIFYTKNLNDASKNLVKKDLIGESTDYMDSFQLLKNMTNECN